jgi:hypothetical protein
MVYNGQNTICAENGTVLSPSGPSFPLQKQLPLQGASLNSNYNAIEILTIASPDTIFSKYLQTFNSLLKNPLLLQL